MNKKEIANSFSNGKFEITYPYLAENVGWEVVGERFTQGKQNVLEQCIQIAHYFQSVPTRFQTIQIIEDEKNVVITGTADFLHNGHRLKACDVYTFNEENQLILITSYCIKL